jgi:DNA adenine methylase
MPIQKREAKSEGPWLRKRSPRPPVAWYGGKNKHANWILEHFDDHRVYVEPFGGMANVLLKKRPSEVEIYNDLDLRVPNLFSVIRDPNGLPELQRRLKDTPCTKTEFSRFVEMPPPVDPIENAHWFFVRCRQARSGLGMSKLTANSYSECRRPRRDMPELTSKWLSSIDGLPKVAKRFEHVVIEAKQATEIMRTYDGVDTLFYCDPPYLPSTRHGGRAVTYAVEMSEQDHVDLLEVLKQIEGQVILSGNPSRLYDEMLAGWRRVERDCHTQASNSGKSRKEVLWIKRRDNDPVISPECSRPSNQIEKNVPE